MPIPFEPESVESLKKRFPECLERVWMMKDIRAGQRPGLDRKYVFDFPLEFNPAGFRLLISKDRLLMGSLDIHISCSWENDVLTPKTMILATIQAQTAYNAICNDSGRGQLRFMGISQNGIPHWNIRIGD